MSHFITFEGIDGCGKTTQWNLLRDWLGERGQNVIATREPGGTALAESIRHQLLHGSQPIVPRAEVLLFGASRAQHVAQLIQPALARGAWILCDRFIDSTLAYQGGGLQMDDNFLRAMNDFACATTQPELTLLFDVKPAIALQRRELRVSEHGAKADHIEARGAQFQERVRQSFLDLAATNSERIVVIDAQQTPDVIQNQVLEILRERGWLANLRESIEAI